LTTLVVNKILTSSHKILTDIIHTGSHVMDIGYEHGWSHKKTCKRKRYLAFNFWHCSYTRAMLKALILRIYHKINFISGISTCC